MNEGFGVSEVLLCSYLFCSFLHHKLCSFLHISPQFCHSLALAVTSCDNITTHNTDSVTAGRDPSVSPFSQLGQYALAVHLIRNTCTFMLLSNKPDTWWQHSVYIHVDTSQQLWVMFTSNIGLKN